MGRRILTPAFALCVMVPAAWLCAATTQVIRDDQFQVFQEGELDGVAASSDGFLTPSFGRRVVGDTGTEIVWNVLDDPGKGVLCATGHEGKLIRLGLDGKPAVLADFQDAEITALTRLRDGSALLATAPGAHLFQLGADDHITTLTKLDARFVWDLEADDSGAVWAATGSDGKLFKVTLPSGDVKETKVEAVLDLKSRNLIDLWIDREGQMGEKGLLYIAAQDPGWLYRHQPGEAKASVILNAECDEIRSLLPGPQGLILATNTDRAPSPQALNMTLRMSGAPPIVKSPGADAAPPPPGGPTGGGPPPGGSGTPDLSEIFGPASKKPKGGPASNLVLLTREGFTRVLWSAPERPIHSVALSPDGGYLVAAGATGRLFEVSPREDFALVADMKEDYIVRIVPNEKGWLLAGARNGVIYQMDRARAEKAVYRSRTLDAGTQANWGRLYLSAVLGEGQKASVAFRRGNTDDTEEGNWEDWTADQGITAGHGIAAPAGPARYLQYRITFEQGPKPEPLLRADYVEVFFQPPNRAPRIRKIVAESARPAPRPSGGEAGGGGSGESGGSGGTPPGPGAINNDEAQPGGRKPDSNGKTINLSWQAEDANNDQLVYEIYYRAGDESDWKLIEDKFRANRIPLGVGMVGDGKYRFRVVVSDQPDNPLGAGLQSELISDEVTIDNTPPRVDDLKVRPEGNTAQVTFRVMDDLSLISSIAADLDGGDSHPVLPTDGLYDQNDESVDWTIKDLKTGEHVLTINTTDRRGNTSGRRIVFRTGG